MELLQNAEHVGVAVHRAPGPAGGEHQVLPPALRHHRQVDLAGIEVPFGHLHRLSQVQQARQVLHRRKDLVCVGGRREPDDLA